MFTVAWSALVAAALAQDADDVQESGFYAGSYGRAQASFDLTGGRGDPVNVASYGTRAEAGPYLELDLGWRTKTKSDAKFNVLVTPALSGDVFHYTGQFNAQLAVRNLFAEAKDFLPGVPMTVWAGSRMYRGDDIYLLNFWPMDNLNTVGAGLQLHPKGWGAEAHVGPAREARADPEAPGDAVDGGSGRRRGRVVKGVR
jgi:maltoporin